jgi:hypothetical protein
MEIIEGVLKTLATFVAYFAEMIDIEQLQSEQSRKEIGGT